MVVSHNTGDKSVTMCGVAQEDISKKLAQGTLVHTQPWHVTVSMTGVRALHSRALKQAVG